MSGIGWEVRPVETGKNVMPRAGVFYKAKQDGRTVHVESPTDACHFTKDSVPGATFTLENGRTDLVSRWCELGPTDT